MSNTDSVSDVNGKPKRRIGCFALGLMGLLCIATLLVVAFFVWRNVASQRLNIAIAALKAGGHPTTAEELMETYQQPAGVNTAPLWIEAGEAMDESGSSIAKLPFIGGEADEPVLPGQPWDQLEPTRAFLKRHADSISKLEQAASIQSIPRYETKLVWDGPEDSMTSIPYAQTHRHICRVMGMAAYVHAHDGNTEGVAKSIETGLRVAHSISDEPVSMGQLLGTACGAMSLANLKDLISLDFQDQELKGLQGTIREFIPQKSLLRGMQGETVHVIHSFKNPKMTGPIPRYDDAAHFVEQVVPLLEVVQKGDWQDIRKAGEAIEASQDQIQQSGGPNASRYALSTHVLPSVVALSKAKVREAATLSVYDTLIAARRFELANDRLPTSINELVPKFLPNVPLDPYSNSGEPIVLKTEGSTTKIYSIGFNTEDDGGDDSQGESGRPKDIVVQLSRSQR